MNPGLFGLTPVMDLVAGPQGSGKSTFFPVQFRGFDAFNIDEHRRKLNRGSAQDIPAAVRTRARRDYDAFIRGHIRRGTGFSIEATLAKSVTLTQARSARDAGFRVQLTYVAAELDECLRRVANRLDLGGHGVSPAVLRRTYHASMRNLPLAMRQFDLVQIYDNSRAARPEDPDKECMPRFAMEVVHGVITFSTQTRPSWLCHALAGTEFDTT